MGRVDDDEAGGRPKRRDQAVDVQRPAIALAELVERDVGARRATDLVETLVARPRYDGMVAWLEHDVGEAEDRLLGSGEDEDAVGVDGVVEPGDLRAQERMARRLRVAQTERRPEPARLVIREAEELGHPPPLDVRCAQQMADGELPAGEEAFEGELGDAHRAMIADPAASVDAPRRSRRTRHAFSRGR